MKRLSEFCVILILIAACNTPAEKKKILDYGKIENAVYTNGYFGVSLTIPENWSVQSQQQTEAIVKEGNDLIKSSNETLSEQLDLASQKTVYLLTVFQHEVGSVESFNPSFMLMAEKLPIAASLMDAKGYLSQTGKVLKQTGQYADLKDHITKMPVGGKEFYSMDAVMNLGDLIIKQRFIATVTDGYALVFILTSDDNEHRDMIQNIMNTVKFDQ